MEYFSHRNSALTNELAKRGHNITIISPDYDMNPPAGVHYIIIENQYEDVHKEFIEGKLASTETVNPFLEV